MAAMILANVLQPFPEQRDRTQLASLLALVAGFSQKLGALFEMMGLKLPVGWEDHRRSQKITENRCYGDSCLFGMMNYARPYSQ